MTDSVSIKNPIVKAFGLLSLPPEELQPISLTETGQGLARTTLEKAGYKLRAISFEQMVVLRSNEGLAPINAHTTKGRILMQTMGRKRLELFLAWAQKFAGAAGFVHHGVLLFTANIFRMSCETNQAGIKNCCDLLNSAVWMGLNKRAKYRHQRDALKRSFAPKLKKPILVAPVPPGSPIEIWNKLVRDLAES